MNPAALVKKYLKKLGVDPEASALYIELVRAGHSSALQLAKTTGISRTQVYRHLELLQAHSLVSAEQLSYGTLYRALPIENIEDLLAHRESETAAIRLNLGAMTAALQTIAGGSGPKATVQHYYGLAGLKQANWNLTRADKEYRVFEAAHLSTHLDKTFARRHRERCMQRGLTSYDLTNSPKVCRKDLEPVDVSKSFVRYIDPSVLTINFEVCMYNDIVLLLDYTEQNSMAVEIHHPTLNKMMTQLFDAMWAQATPLTIS